MSGNREQGLDASIAELWLQARERALGRVDVVEEAVVGLLGGSLDADLADRARREAHKLAGSLGTFGMPVGTDHARAVELCLETGAQPSDAPALADQVTALRQIVEAGPVAPAGAPAAPPGPRDVALIGLPERETDLVRALAELGVAAVAGNAGGAPVALVAGAGLPERVAALAGRGARVAAVVPAGGTNQVELVRRGALRLLPESLSSDAIAGELASLVGGGARRSESRVLIVDDDPDVLARARDVLTAVGHGVTTLDDPQELFPALERTHPDLVVLDVDMPGVDGLALCRALRADAQWSATPVVFLTGAVGAEAVGELFAAGADDYVAKPFAGPELTARIGNRLDRARLLRAAGMTDPVTGLELRGPAHARMRRLVGHADRLGQPVTIGFLRLDDLPADVDAADAALSEAGRALRAVLGADDVAARWADDTLAIARLGGTDPPPSVLLRTVAGELRAAGHPTSTGISRYPDDGADLPAVLAAAAEATAAPEDAVEPAAAAPDDRRYDADVILVEDDDALAEVIAHALRTRGYRTEIIADGDEAAGTLGGATPGLRGRVVLLDWDLPGRDGLTVLRGLAGEGVLDATSVIMLTARASEREVVAALDLGAADHIAKPISLPVLMQKVRRAAGAPQGAP